MEASLVRLSSGNEAACICKEVYSPVCGKDGKVHPNPCRARCRGVGIMCRGTCPCLRIARRRMGGAVRERSVNGKKFNSGNGGESFTTRLLNAGLQGLQALFAPAPAVPDSRVKGFKHLPLRPPPIGTQPPPASNRAGVFRALAPKGRPSQAGRRRRKRPCICNRMYAPVCGVDGRTKSNACMAACRGVAIACHRKCPCASGGGGGRGGGRGGPGADKGGKERSLVSTFRLLPTENRRGDDEKKKQEKKKFCPCPRIRRPVCTAEGNTYPNLCEARCQGEMARCFSSACPCRRTSPLSPPKRSCRCTKLRSPVCATDGREFANGCLARCAGAKLECRRRCPCSAVGPLFRVGRKRCRCPKTVRPVCSAKGKTHLNACMARCRGEEAECSGRCPCAGKTCGCGLTLLPVCSADGRDFESPCTARCAGAEVECLQECPCPAGEAEERREGDRSVLGQLMDHAETGRKDNSSGNSRLEVGGRGKQGRGGEEGNLLFRQLSSTLGKGRNGVLSKNIALSIEDLPGSSEGPQLEGIVDKLGSGGKKRERRRPRRRIRRHGRRKGHKKRNKSDF